MDMTSVIEQYINLLIIQYHNQPKAQAQIALFIKWLLAEGIALQVRDGYNIDTAVGKQLDVIGKYVDIDRFYKDSDSFFEYFAFTDYAEVEGGVIDPTKWGFSTYSTYGHEDSSGWLDYSGIIGDNYRLNDEAFRTLIRLRIIQNNINYSHQSIDYWMFEFFGYDIIPDSDGLMHMVYFVPSSKSVVVKAALDKGVLPRPMGVGVGYIITDEPLFAFSSYSGYSSHDIGITGFSTYADSRKLGEILTYGKMI